MQQLSVPEDTLSEWKKRQIDGSDFAEMSDSLLAKYNAKFPLVVYFRDRSRFNILGRL